MRRPTRFKRKQPAHWTISNLVSAPNGLTSIGPTSTSSRSLNSVSTLVMRKTSGPSNTAPMDTQLLSPEAQHLLHSLIHYKAVLKKTDSFNPLTNPYLQELIQSGHITYQTLDDSIILTIKNTVPSKDPNS